MTGVVVEELTVSYGAVLALQRVSLAARAGQVTGIIGPNGAGKSTVVKALLGLVEVDGGRVTVAGKPPYRARRQMAYLPQRAGIDQDYPVQVREIARMGRYPHRGLLRQWNDTDRAVVEQAMERVGLTRLAQRSVGALSGGQQQRAFVARALAQEPDVFVLDEPFAAIDVPTIELLTAIFREEARRGATVVVVLHDLGLLGRLCDRAVLLNRSVLADGAAPDVLSSPALAHAYGTVLPATDGPAGLA